MSSHAPPRSALPVRPAAGAARWRVQLLGRVQADGPMLSVTRWHSRAVAELLARLALEPDRQHPREELAELLWPGTDAGTGRARLRQALSILRSQLHSQDPQASAILHADRHAVWLNTGAFACDALEFEQLVHAHKTASALTLYAGELMPGHYADWVVEARHRLTALHERARAAEAALPAAPVARPEPVLLPASGASAAPANLAARRATGLPNYWNPGFGLQANVQRLRDALQAHRLVTLVGAGGTGKTRSAVETAHAIATAPDAGQGLRVQFTSLADAQTAEALWESIARDLSIQGPGPAVHRVRATWQSGQHLVVLDNAEDLDDSAGQALEAALAAAPGLHLLITSRRRLGLSGECVIEQRGLPVPPPDATPQQALANPAVALFVDRARASRAGFSPTTTHLQAVVHLVRLLDGMPLAIELAASRIRSLQPPQLLALLQRDTGTPALDLLSRPAAARHQRQASLREVMAWGWQQLRPEVALLLTAMGVFVRPATVEALAEALQAVKAAQQPPSETGATTATTAPHPRHAGPLTAPAPAPIDLAEVALLLDEAADASMVEIRLDDALEAANERATYALLVPVREFAREKAGEAILRAQRLHLRRWLIDLARSGLPRNEDALGPDLAHVLPLVASAERDGDAPLAARLCLQARILWNRDPPPTAVLVLLNQALPELERTGDRTLAAEIHHFLYQTGEFTGQWESAAQHVRQAAELADDDRSQALALSGLGLFEASRGGQPTPGLAHLGQAEAAARRSGDRAALALVLRRAGLAWVHAGGDAQRGERLLSESALLYESLGDRWQAASCRVHLADAWQQTGQHAAAADVLQACATFFSQRGPSVHTIMAWTQLARVRTTLRDWPGAIAAAHRALALLSEGQWGAMSLGPLLVLPLPLGASGRADDAARCFGHAWARRQQLAPLTPADRSEQRRVRRWLRQRLGDQRFETLSSAGSQQDTDSLVEQLLQPQRASAR